MRAWQVQGGGRAGRGAPPGRARAPEPGPGRGADPGHRGRPRSPRRVHVPRHLPAHAAAPVHLGAGGDRGGHRAGRGCRAARARRPHHVRDVVHRRATVRSPRSASPFADGAFAVPDGLTAAEAAGFWIPHLTGWIGLVDRGRIRRGDELVVLGAAGGSGIAAVQLGHAARCPCRRGRERRREGGVLSRARRRRHPEPPRRVRSRRACASSPTAAASTSSTTRSAVTLAEDAAGAPGPPRTAARGRVRERTVADVRHPRARGDQPVTGRRVRGRVLARRARRDPRAARRTRWATGGCATR